MNDKKSGRFIAVEGIDGSGKSTQVLQVCATLKNLGKDVVKTFEPTDGLIGSLIRQMLAGTVPTDQRTIASLFAADRTDHLVRPDTGVCSMVGAGKIVICDRYYFSSYAYHAQFVDLGWVIEANRMNWELLRPHATLFIDVDPAECLRRIQARGGPLEIYEKLDIMKAVRANYLEAFQRLRHEEAVVVIDGNADAKVVFQRIWKAVTALIEND